MLVRGGGYWTELILHVLTHDIINPDKSAAVFSDTVRSSAWQLIAHVYNISGVLTPAVLQTLWDKNANGYSLTHSYHTSLTHSPTHSLTHSLLHLLTYLLTYLLTHSPTHSLTHSLLHVLTYSLLTTYSLNLRGRHHSSNQ